MFPLLIALALGQIQPQTTTPAWIAKGLTLVVNGVPVTGQWSEAPYVVVERHVVSK